MASMASRKMTFTLPEDLARRFVNRVPARNRSRYLSEALAEKLGERERRLIRACEIANQDPEVRTIEEQLDSLRDDIAEPWAPQREPDVQAR
jgi:metal-responsive CopG/Arc/MetJ family transcriptional regulator